MKIKIKKGEYGYIDNYKKNKLIMSLIFALMIAFIIITMLYMFGSTQNIIVIFAILLVLPFSKYIIAYIMCFNFKTMSKDNYNIINNKLNHLNDKLLFDIVITQTQGMLFYNSIFVCNSHIYAYIEEDKNKDDLSKYEDWLKKSLSGLKLNLAVSVTKDLDIYIQKVNNSVSDTENEKIDKYIADNILILCV